MADETVLVLAPLSVLPEYQNRGLVTPIWLSRGSQLRTKQT
ncbi:hypothetical protein N1495_07280 [Streptococcus didelphis]|uniref:Acetyltransferase n=1 Tax=Streptococcus didelphis TaxID=102886 RepID=A0ABY9LI68_9STRE|nr:hypothetical protein [Streptococcus didelphis]WMB28521.1 hypothetical protein N1496_02850 [Streptococcus didelphis]WMB29195.1 hypothetical protein N1495_07280 [Streptococcus didelphis]